MQEQIKHNLIDAVLQHYKVDINVELSRPEAQFGDISTNLALVLAKQVGQKPQQIAQQLADELQKLDVVREVSVAGPGFINIWLSDEALAVDVEAKTRVTTNRGQVYVVETNNPNPFKDLHIGHAYNCIVADTLANLLETSSAHVHRVGYHGDVGLHVGKSMWAILNKLESDKDYLDKIKPAEQAQFMSDCYREGSEAYRLDDKAKAEIEQLAKQSFKPEGQFKRVYETSKKWSFDYIDEVLERIGSKPVEKHYLESEADVAGEKIVRLHVGDVFSESNGAIVFAGEAFNLHTRVFIASRGTTLYEARDLGLMQLKQADYNPSKSLIVTGEEQKEYFKVVLKAAELAIPELTGVTQNISTGMVKLSTGKMSSRTGEVLNIEWIFDQLKEALVKRGGSASDQATLLGALRYQMLKNSIGPDMVFDVEKALSLEGNSGPYLQYAHARAVSILAKSTRLAKLSNGYTFDKSERQLAAKLSHYNEVLEKACVELTPHVICNYLYSLAKQFNKFYESSTIIDHEREELRLWLVKNYQQTLADGLTVLGIPAPKRM